MAKDLENIKRGTEKWKYSEVSVSSAITVDWEKILNPEMF